MVLSDGELLPLCLLPTPVVAVVLYFKEAAASTTLLPWPLATCDDPMILPTTKPEVPKPWATGHSPTGTKGLKNKR